MSKKIILLALVILVVVVVIGYLFIRKQPAVPTVPVANDVTPPQRTIPPMNETKIPEFTVEEILSLAYEDAATFQELIGQTVKVRGFIRDIDAGLTEMRPGRFRLHWSIVVVEYDYIWRGFVQIVAEEKDAYFGNKIEARLHAPFLFNLVEKTKHWEKGDEVILKGKILEHLSSMDAAEWRIFTFKEGVIYLKIESIERIP